MQSSLNELYNTRQNVNDQNVNDQNVNTGQDNTGEDKSKTSFAYVIHEFFENYVQYQLYLFMVSLMNFLSGVCLNIQNTVYSKLYVDESSKMIQKKPFEKLYSKEETYAKEESGRFHKIFDLSSEQMNANTDKEFYDMEVYKSTIADEANDFEKKWTRRILYNWTPRGNIIMYYDVYKKGFAYYCDSTGIPYIVLNAVAKKYVRTFMCRDLFMDDSEEEVSPLIQLQEIEEKKEKEKKTEKFLGLNKEVSKNAPFAKLKRYNLEDKSESAKDEKKIVMKNTNINKFIYKGKTLNFSLLQKIPRRRTVIPFTNSKFMDMFEKEHELQKSVMSYADYKKANLKID